MKYIFFQNPTTFLVFYYITITNIFQYKFHNSPRQHCRDRRPRLSSASLPREGDRRRWWKEFFGIEVTSLSKAPPPCANISRATRNSLPLEGGGPSQMVEGVSSLQTNFFRCRLPYLCANKVQPTRQAHSIFARKSQIFFKNACFVPFALSKQSFVQRFLIVLT